MASEKVCPSCGKVSSAIALACDCGAILGEAIAASRPSLRLERPTDGQAGRARPIAKYRLACSLNYRDFGWTGVAMLVAMVWAALFNAGLGAGFGFAVFLYVLITIINKIEVHSAD